MSVLVEGDRITVEPEDVRVNDFLEYAELAIERFGWRQGDRKQVTEGDDMVQVAEKDGLSLHDAIGYTNVMLGNEPGKPTGKDGSTITASGSRAMRNEMTQAVQKVLPKGKDDKTFNDEAKSVEDVIAVLRLARGAA